MSQMELGTGAMLRRDALPWRVRRTEARPDHQPGLLWGLKVPEGLPVNLEEADQVSWI